MPAALLTSGVSTGTAGSGTQVVVTRNAAVVNGDKLLAVIADRFSSAVYTTPPAGWSLVTSEILPSTLGVISVWAKTAASEPASWTWAGGSTSSRHAAVVFRTTDLDFTSLLDVKGTAAVAVNGATTSGTVTMPSLTPTDTGRLLLGVLTTHTQNNTPHAMAPPASMSLAASAVTGTGSADTSIAVGQQLLDTSAATGTRVWTASQVIAGASGFLVALRASTTTPPVTETPISFTAVDLVSGTVAVGGSALAAESDASDATYTESVTGGISDRTLPSIQPPAGNLVVTLRTLRSGGTSGTYTVTLRDGGTTVATATAAPASPGTSAGDQVFTFSAASISGVTQAKWASGTLKVRAVASVS
jgi:hypothetical protein